MHVPTGKTKLDRHDASRGRGNIASGARVFSVWALAAVCLASHAWGQAQPAGTEAAPVVQPGAPGAPSKTLPSSTHAVAPKLSQADVEFMQGMIMHHGQAVEMTALIPSHTEN